MAENGASLFQEGTKEQLIENLEGRAEELNEERRRIDHDIYDVEKNMKHIRDVICEKKEQLQIQISTLVGMRKRGHNITKEIIKIEKCIVELEEVVYA